MSDRSQSAYVRDIRRVFGSMPWLRPRDKQRFQVKIFKSGNSLALRLPAGLGLAAGMAMNLEVDNDMNFSFEPIDPPKRKFDIGKVAGSAVNLTPIASDDRTFTDRSLAWPNSAPADDAS